MNNKKSGNGVLSVIVTLFLSLVAAFVTFLIMQDSVITAAMALVTAIAVSVVFLIHAIETQRK